MAAYDAGGLTFEIASLFVGPAAVGKIAKGTKLGAKAAEMIQLAKNSTKARILANVEKWGSKVDNILAKSNNVIGKFGEKLLDTRIPVGIRKEAVAFAGGKGTMPAFSVESKTLRDVMHFSSKHADDAVRGVGGSGRTTSKLRDSVLEGAKSKGKARYGERKISDEEYAKLRKMTLSRNIRNNVNKDIQLPMPNPAIPGKIIEIGERLEADHIVSMDRITKMEGFEKMTLKQKLDVLNYEENFIGLSKTANTSKGSNSYSEWTRYVKENIPISADFKSAMIAKKRELEVVLQNLIDSFN